MASHADHGTATGEAVCQRATGLQRNPSSIRRGHTGDAVNWSTAVFVGARPFSGGSQKTWRIPVWSRRHRRR
jgi:hypothetical protein